MSLQQIHQLSLPTDNTETRYDFPFMRRKDHIKLIKYKSSQFQIVQQQKTELFQIYAIFIYFAILLVLSLRYLSCRERGLTSHRYSSCI